MNQDGLNITSSNAERCGAGLCRRNTRAAESISSANMLASLANRELEDPSEVRSGLRSILQSIAPLRILLQSVFLVSFATSAQATEIFDFYTGARQLGMGGAYTAVVNDETAVLTNPAGLGKLRDITFTLFDPELHGAFKNTEVAKLDNFTNVMSIQGLLDALKQSRGTHWHSKLQFFPSIVGPNFGTGLHAKYQWDAEVNEDGTVYRMDYTNDLAAVLGYCFRFWGGIVKLGTTMRAVNRVEVHQDLDATATNLELQNVASEGLGVAGDVGLIISAPVALLPALSVVARDVGNTRYDLSDGVLMTTSTRPEETKQRIDAGLAIFPILGNHTRATITAEYHDLQTASEETDHSRRIHAGAELNVHDFFFLRAGMNQRYYTGGIELASEKFQLQAATYGEEIGTASTPREDRRWIAKFSLRF